MLGLISCFQRFERTPDSIRRIERFERFEQLELVRSFLDARPIKDCILWRG